MKDEICRRASFLKLRIVPRPGQWKLDDKIKWLDNNTITKAHDVQYITKTNDEYKQSLLAVIQEQSTITKPGKWSGPLPYLRLIHCMVEDDVKIEFNRRCDVLSNRYELDARNSDQAKKSFFELCADKWNDPSFNPWTMIVGETHSDYAAPIYCSHLSVSRMSPATSEKVAEKFGYMRLKLTDIIINFEMSGGGDGQKCEKKKNDAGTGTGTGTGGDSDSDEDSDSDIDSENEEDNNHFGSLKTKDGSIRKNFLQEFPPYLLYFWDMLELHGMTSSAMQKISEEHSAGSAGKVPRASFETPGAQTEQRKKKANTVNSTAEVVALAEVNKNLSDAVVHFKSSSYDDTRDRLTRALEHAQRERNIFFKDQDNVAEKAFGQSDQSDEYKVYFRKRLEEYKIELAKADLLVQKAEKNLENHIASRELFGSNIN